MPASETQDLQAHADIEADLADIPFRQPIVDDYSPDIHKRRPGEELGVWFERLDEDRKTTKARDAKIDHEWLALTEAARRSINRSSDTRQAIARFSGEPLSEACLLYTSDAADD